VALAGPSKSGKTFLVEKVVGRHTLIAVQVLGSKGPTMFGIACWTALKLRRNGAFENYRARLNRIFDVGSDELYKPEQAV
jgi:hypothetical protein